MRQSVDRHDRRHRAAQRSQHEIEQVLARSPREVWGEFLFVSEQMGRPEKRCIVDAMRVELTPITHLGPTIARAC